MWVQHNNIKVDTTYYYCYRIKTSIVDFCATKQSHDTNKRDTSEYLNLSSIAVILRTWSLEALRTSAISKNGLMFWFTH